MFLLLNKALFISKRHKYMEELISLMKCIHVPGVYVPTSPDVLVSPGTRAAHALLMILATLGVGEEKPV